MKKNKTIRRNNAIGRYNAKRRNKSRKAVNGGSCFSTLHGTHCTLTNPYIANGGKYKPTEKDKYYLSKYERGESIGFTMTSSLKAKGLIPRANGTKRVSAKYTLFQKKRSKMQ